jgi:hypothetical protein
MRTAPAFGDAHALAAENGRLTAELAQRARRVVAVEIDPA